MASTSPEIDKLAAALAIAQGAFKNPAKDRQNPHFKNRYATLDSAQTATRPILAENGLAVVQTVEDTEHYMRLCTRLIHASGQWIESVIPLYQAAKGPQAFGSEIKYMRRYAYEAILNIAADEDDDGEAAQAGSTTPAPVHRRPAPVKEPTPALSFLERAEEALLAEADEGRWVKLLEQVYKRAPTLDDLAGIEAIDSVKTARARATRPVRTIIERMSSEAATRLAPQVNGNGHAADDAPNAVTQHLAQGELEGEFEPGDPL